MSINVNKHTSMGIANIPLRPRFTRLYIKKYYWEKASVYKYIQLLSARNFKELCNIGCYLQHAFERRESILRSFSGWLVSVFVLINTMPRNTFFFSMLHCINAMRCRSSAIKYIYILIFIILHDKWFWL